MINNPQELSELRVKYQAFVTDLLTKFPKVKYIITKFQGSGDSFDSFHSISIAGKDKAVLINSDEICSNYDIEDILSPIWWEAIEALGAGFNNDGSQGTITIDVITHEITAEFDWFVQETIHGGDLDSTLKKLLTGKD